METKTKSGSKAPKVEKKDPPPPKPEPAPPAEPEEPAEGAGQEGQEVQEGTGSGCEFLENLKPFIIGGAVVALGAILVGVILLAKKN